MMAKRTVDVAVSDEFLRQCAVELERIDRDAVPAPLTRLFSEGHGREYYVGLLFGYENASALDSLASRVASARRQILELRYEGRLVVIGGRKLRLPAVDFAFYAVLARRRMEGGPQPEHAFAAWDTPGLTQDFLRVYRRLTHDWDGNGNRVLRNLEKNGIERGWFDVRKSKVNGAIGSLGLLGSACRIFSEGRPPDKLSGLTVAPDRIRIRDGPSVASTGGVSAGCSPRARPSPYYTSRPSRVAPAPPGPEWLGAVDRGHTSRPSRVAPSRGPGRRPSAARRKPRSSLFFLHSPCTLPKNRGSFRRWS